MAEQEHLDRLKQGMYIWSVWRTKHPEIYVDLSDANLSDANLAAFNLSGVSLRGADLSNADLSGAFLSGANLIQANLSNAGLGGARLINANLGDADLTGTDLLGANLSGADLSGADLSEAFVGETFFGALDLRWVKGLETIVHIAPSNIGTDTLEKSEGDIPEIFLRSAGLSDAAIAYAHSLKSRSIEYYTCFISYSSRDSSFAKRLHADLEWQGVRCWFAPEDMDIGDKIRLRIDESIGSYDKLVLILSQASVESTWVIYEVERALNKEPAGVPNVLYPIRIDDAVMHSTASWVQDIRGTRHIGDFTQWKDPNAYQQAFTRLLRALNTAKRQG